MVAALMSDESAIDDLLDQWESAIERGETLSVDDLCHDQPDLKAEVSRQISALQAMDQHIQDPADRPLDGLGGNLFSVATGRSATEPPMLAFETDVDDLVFHAKGGLGAVYVGGDRQLNRRVAVKFIHRALASDKESCDRFQLEAEVTGRLEHPGVIPMYGVGKSENGRPFYAMRFIDGHTLDEAIRRFYGDSSRREQWQSIEFRRLLQCFVSICETIAYAHNRGIVHRDIKPDNVLLGRYGETIVVDWGLAVPVIRDERFRISGEQTLLPRSGSSPSNSSRGAGTPAYMSPEQASELAPTPASDIYSLGATLFKVLTGRPPVSGESLQEIKTNVIEGRLPRPTDLRRGVPGALEAICRKAMSLNPNDRYTTAIDLARDVERHLADEPIEVYRESASQTVGRSIRRHRLAAFVAFIGLTGCLFIAGLASVWLASSAREESQARGKAEAATKNAELARRQNLGASSMFLAKSLSHEVDLRWRILEAEAASPSLRQLMTEINQINLAAGKAAADTTELQRWVEKRWIANSNAFRSTCWAINGIDGTQVARVPEIVNGKRASSLGNNYRHRDYFHGEGRDFTNAELHSRNDVLPLAEKDVYVSAVFESVNTKTLMVTFSVPIWSGPPEEVGRHRIGILAAPVELGDFGVGKNAMLADTRKDQLNGAAGLVLHHPDLGKRHEGEELPYLDQATLDVARRLTESDLNNPGLTRTFYDPVTKQERLSSIEPVMIRGRKHPERETGWVVIAMEQLPEHVDE